MTRVVSMCGSENPIAPLIWAVPGFEQETWDYLGALLLIFDPVVRRLLEALAVVLRDEIVKDVERFNRALPVDPRRCWSHIFAVIPATLVTWRGRLVARE